MKMLTLKTNLLQVDNIKESLEIKLLALWVNIGMVDDRHLLR